MRVFVTGSTGFIGSHVIHALKKRGHKVQGLSSRLESLKAVERELKRFKPDVVLHAAWEGLPDIGPQMCVKNLTEGVAFFALLARLCIPKVVALGSCWECEDKAAQKKGKHEAFVATKESLRVMGTQLFEEYGGTFVWAVPFFVYGAGKKTVSLLPSLIAQAKRGEMPMPKNLNAWHDFVYINDVAEALALLCTEKVAAGSYDIGTGKLTRTGDIATVVARAFQLPPPRLRVLHRKRHGLRARVRSLQRATGWRPKTSVSQGVRLMVQQLYG